MTPPLPRLSWRVRQCSQRNVIGRVRSVRCRHRVFYLMMLLPTLVSSFLSCAFRSCLRNENFLSGRKRNGVAPKIYKSRKIIWPLVSISSQLFNSWLLESLNCSSPVSYMLAIEGNCWLEFHTQLTGLLEHIHSLPCTSSSFSFQASSLRPPI